MTPIQIFLPLLSGVKNSGKDKWLARCPAHEDKHPSLSVRQFDDGSISVKCFTGCPTADILAAVSLNPSDLFPRQHNNDTFYRSPHNPPPWRELIAYLREDLQAVQIGSARLAAGDELAEPDLDRMGTAALRIYELLQVSA